MTCVLAKNTGKAFFHVAKIYCLVMTLYEVFNGYKHFFFSFCGESMWEWKENGCPFRAQVSCSLADPTTTYK